MDREKINLLYDLLDEFYDKHLDFKNSIAENKASNNVIELQEFISENFLNITQEWNIKKVV